jgi:phosphoribosylamine--glycine ligase
MKILVVGGGGREHALVWRLAQGGHHVIAAPGNPGIAATLGRPCEPTKVDDFAGLIALAKRDAVELVVVGPEGPLVAGFADRAREAGLLVFGPSAAGAQLEGSKTFSKQFFARHQIPTAGFAIAATVDEADRAIDALTANGGNVVVKVDGLAAGKGVVVANDVAEARAAAREMLGGRFGTAGAQLVIEQRIIGREVSVLALTDGSRLEVLPAIEDHKTIFDGDRGPNTGGMGTVSPAWVSAAACQRIRHEILEPTVRGLRADGIDYRGVLYAGVMVDPAGAPYLLEYNCRFGDPETQPIMARMRGDFGVMLHGAARGEMPIGGIAWDARVAVCVVVAAAGYPGEVRTGDPIRGLDATSDVVVFHAGTAMQDGALVTAGGRVLGITALGIGVDQAREKAYAAIDKIELDGKQFRRDIGQRR